MIRIGILGAGTWGVALAKLMADKGNEVKIWSSISSEIDTLRNTYKHPKLKNVTLPRSLKFTKSIEDVCANIDILIFAVPSIYIREVAKIVKPFVKNNQIIINVSKGFDHEKMMTLSEVIFNELDNGTIKLAVLSGPTHAEEVAMEMITTIVCACNDIKIAEYIQKIFSNEYLRVYTNNDIRGVEISGALKNIVAIAAGISEGVGNGDNAKAALITRGFMEISKLGVCMGCNEKTFSGLAGIGDIIVTCTSIHSRNNQAGILIGKGEIINNSFNNDGMVIEGINALKSAIKLADIYKVDMPIIKAVHDIIYKGKDPKEIINGLMKRELKSELI